LRENQILAAVLGQLPRENRLYRTLVVDKQLAVQANAASRQSELRGSFVVTISARPGQRLDDLVKIADEQIWKLEKEGPTQNEVVKAQNAHEASLILGLQSATRLADFLNSNNVEFGDPRAYAGRMRKLFAVTAQDVKWVARKYLTGGRARLDINPGPLMPRTASAVDDRRKSASSLLSPQPSAPKAAESVAIRPGQGGAGTVSATAAIVDTFDRSKMPEIGQTAAFNPPPIVRRKLSNGLLLGIDQA
jgi:zinc protease